MLQQAREKESAVSSMLEYTIITAILMLLFLKLILNLLRKHRLF